MDRVELHDVEYGDCTVLVGQNRQILMVDCGSVKRRLTAVLTKFSAVTVPLLSASFCSRTTTATT